VQRHNQIGAGDWRGLGADYLLESAVRRAKGIIRVTVRLIRARDQIQIWGRKFDRDMGSILHLQEDVGRAIAKHIQKASRRSRSSRTRGRLPSMPMHTICISAESIIGIKPAPRRFAEPLSPSRPQSPKIRHSRWLGPT
jgi:hypothetical protein